MFSKVLSAHVLGIQGTVVEVEADIASMGLPSFSIVGLAEGAVRESKDRVRSSLKNIGFNIFSRPITVNLAPADFRKEGTHFDLPLAVSLIAASGDINLNTSKTMFLGELSLDGMLRPVAGVLPSAYCAKQAGVERIIVPADNAQEAALVDGVQVYGFHSIGDVLNFLTGEVQCAPVKADIAGILSDNRQYEHDFSDVKGQMSARRASETAAAGMHNIIFIGTPGSGKTMIARRIPSILPLMTLEEAIETTKIHSVAGLLNSERILASRRPFVSPHHTASNVSIIGGTGKAKPGQVSIAHNGVLFLDEMLEFNRNVLETLRQPLEDGEVTVTRADRSVRYPADFMFVAASNPCPCGYLGDLKKECTCTQNQIQKYKSRLSGPLVDRIDIHIEVQALGFDELSRMKEGEPSASVRERVARAHDIQLERFKNSSIRYNSQMSEPDIRKHCRVDDKSAGILKAACEKFGFSARAYSKILKVARTLADLEASADVQPKHILEAVQYRILDRQV